MDRSEYDALRYEALRTLGLCATCAKRKREPGRVRCAQCAKRNAERTQAGRRRRKEERC